MQTMHCNSMQQDLVCATFQAYNLNTTTLLQLRQL